MAYQSTSVLNAIIEGCRHPSLPPATGVVTLGTYLFKEPSYSGYIFLFSGNLPAGHSIMRVKRIPL